MSYGTAKTFITAEELVLTETAQRGVRMAERDELSEEVREAGRVRLTYLLKSVMVEACGRERLARIVDGREGTDRPSGLREPSDELDPVMVCARHACSDEDRGTRAQHAADLVCGGSYVWDVLNDIGEPGGVY